jgi:rhamnose transport system permease protein
MSQSTVGPTLSSSPLISALLNNRTPLLAIFFVLELAAFGLLMPDYLSLDGVLDTSRVFMESGLLSLGMTLVIITGGIDLSVASLLALVSVVIGFSHHAGLPLPLAMGLGIATGAGCGLLNGALVAYFGLHPLVVTLATMALFRGAAYVLSNAEAFSNYPQWFVNIGGYYIDQVLPAQLPFFIVVCLIIWILLAKTSFGRTVYGLGENELAVRFSGVNVEKAKLKVYGLMGLLVSLAAIIETSRISTSRANMALGLELPVIAAVVLGGTKVTGGYGTIAGTLLGLLILSYLNDGLQFAGVSSDWGLVITGCLLVLGVLVNENVGKLRD